MKKEVVVNGIPSGDMECWCFLVTAEDYKRVTGRDPEGWEGRFPQGDYKYALYPSDLILEKDPGKEGVKPVVSLFVTSAYSE